MHGNVPVWNIHVGGPYAHTPDGIIRSLHFVGLSLCECPCMSVRSGGAGHDILVCIKGPLQSHSVMINDVLFGPRRGMLCFYTKNINSQLYIIGEKSQ